MIETILKGYKYEGINGLITSTFPSLKYNLFMSILSVSTVITCLAEAIGLGFYSVVAVVVALFAELGSGVYCSLWIRKEKFESGKLSRFGLKVSLLFIVLFITNSWKNDFIGQGLKEEVFEWINTFIVIYSLLEILISVLENYAEIQGKPKDYYSSFIKNKLDKIFNNGKESE